MPMPNIDVALTLTGNELLLKTLTSRDIKARRFGDDQLVFQFRTDPKKKKKKNRYFQTL